MQHINFYLGMLLDRHSNSDGQPDGLFPVDVQQPSVGVQGRTSMARLTQANLWGRKFLKYCCALKSQDILVFEQVFWKKLTLGLFKVEF